MHPFFGKLPLTFAIVFSFFCNSNLLVGQDCASLLVENKKINQTQIARTKPITVVVRGSYNYTIEFFSDEKGLFARLTSIGGIEFNQDDQVVFVDLNGNERAYKFASLGEVGTGSVPTHRNNLRLDLDALKWLSENQLGGINLINFVERQKHKFTINPNGQTEMKNLATCFYTSLDPSMIADGGSALVTKNSTSGTTTTPTTGGGATTTTTGGSGVT